MEALDIFDYCQTIFIVVALVPTIPLACYVYFKLFFVRPYSENYTFKLIVLNGTTELFNCIVYIFTYQLSTYPFMYGFYVFVQGNGIAIPLSVLNGFTSCLGLNSSLFIALNRLNTLFNLQKQSDDSMLFFVSLAISIALSLPTLVDNCFTTHLVYRVFKVGGSLAFLPDANRTSDVPRVISTVITIAVSLATLAANMYLCVLVTRERKFIDISDRKRFNGEKGLAVTSIVSYCFYMLYFLIARFFDSIFCGYAQFLFLGLNSMTPFWCLILFSSTVRQFAFVKNTNSTTSTNNTWTTHLSRPTALGQMN